MERLRGLDGIVEEVAWMIEGVIEVQDRLKGGLGPPLGEVAHITKVGLRDSHAVLRSKGPWPLSQGTSPLCTEHKQANGAWFIDRKTDMLYKAKAPVAVCVVHPDFPA